MPVLTWPETDAATEDITDDRHASAASAPNACS